MKIREYELRTSPSYRRKSVGRRSVDLTKLRRMFSFERTLSVSPTKQAKISKVNKDDLLAASNLVHESQTAVAAALMGSLRGGSDLLFSRNVEQGNNYFLKSNLASVRESVDDCYVTLRPFHTTAVSPNSLNLHSTSSTRSKKSPARKHSGLVSFEKPAQRGSAASALSKFRKRSKAPERRGCEGFLPRKNGELYHADNESDSKPRNSTR